MKIAIVGAGIGGLSAAIALAAQGHTVQIFEKEAQPGGKLGQRIIDGFRFDTGPSVITMLEVYDRLFTLAHRNIHDYVTFKRLDPITRYFWPDGLVLDATADLDAMCERIAQFSPQDAGHYRQFMSYTQALYARVKEPFLLRSQPTLKAALQMPILDVLRIDAWRTMHQAIAHYLRDPHLVQLFDRFATYNGSSPYMAPATLNVIAHIEMALGAYYPQGGVFELAQAYAKLAAELGVDLHYNTAVTEVQTQNNTVTGIRLHNGAQVQAKTIVINTDHTWAMTNLVRQRHARRTATPNLSSSALVLFIGCEQTNAQLTHHNVLFCDPSQYRQEFDALHTQKQYPSNPTIYLCITCKSDTHHAPPGKENWFAMVNLPSDSAERTNAAQTQAYANAVAKSLTAKLACHGKVRVLDQITPQDFYQAYGTPGGALYGASSNNRLAAFKRPGNRHKNIRGLYFAGGSVHPGGGVPLATLSGMAAASAIQEDHEND
jgi:phytoene desaturase